MTAFSATAPRLLPCWEAHVDIAQTQAHGPGPFGNRNVVPIIGGRFAGQIALETDAPIDFNGAVLPGGFDLQRERADGCKELEAIYHMQTEDGITVEIRNLALLTYNNAGALDYARCRIFAEAPAGRLNWLNERVFVGTLEVVRPQKQVLIRSFVLV